MAIRASSSPQIVPVPMSDEEAVDPEEAFIAAIASCHMLFFLSLASAAHLAVTSYCDNATGVLKRSGRSMAFETIQLSPKITVPRASTISRDLLETLHHRAHDQCFLANSVSFPIQCQPDFSFDAE
ncbi:OsmC family protein [Qipengyuania sp. 6B39]|uniref:OsmC family protein n=1 Tax=Qipengyuania proteolytica TaxID=2867239 RepID=UPI001C897E00|nr:OsmC family protein [Qipengyuania proteolytica]MBX7494295.1 OsmC family protein [Qipengyuania proteolytica]